MKRAQMIATFLAMLDEIAACPHFASGSPSKPILDCDTVMGILLGQIDSWDKVPYPTIREMFAALLEGAPLDDVERLLASASREIETAEECSAVEAAEKAQALEEARTQEMARLAALPVDAFLKVVRYADTVDPQRAATQPRES